MDRRKVNSSHLTTLTGLVILLTHEIVHKKRCDNDDNDDHNNSDNNRISGRYFRVTDHSESWSSVAVIVCKTTTSKIA